MISDIQINLTTQDSLPLQPWSL